MTAAVVALGGLMLRSAVRTAAARHQAADPLTDQAILGSDAGGGGL